MSRFEDSDVTPHSPDLLFLSVSQMLHCIVGMVDKCKRALSVLRDRSQREGDDVSAWARQHADSIDPDMKSRASDIVACTLRQTEDRVADVKRTAGTHTI